MPTTLSADRRVRDLALEGDDHEGGPVDALGQLTGGARHVEVSGEALDEEVHGRQDQQLACRACRQS